MIDLISKKISFSEPEQEADGTFNGYIGLSIIPIQRNANQVITNISLTKQSDSSFEKLFTGIEIIDLSSSPDIYATMRNLIFQTVQDEDGSQNISITKTTDEFSGNEPLEPDDPDSISGRSIPYNGYKAIKTIDNILKEDHRLFKTSLLNNYEENIPTYIEKKILYKFKSIIQSIETILSVDIYFAKSDFLFTLFSELGSTVNLNNSNTSIFTLKSKNLMRNFQHKTPDYTIAIDQKNFVPFTESDSLEYITTISTSLISNYSYKLPVNNSYDFILLLPSCSKKTFSGSDESFNEFSKIQNDERIQDLQNEILEWSQTQKTFSEKFTNDLKTYLDNFQNKVKESNLKDSFSVIKDVQGIFNANLLTEVS
jgi:hypothetical protein